MTLSARHPVLPLIRPMLGALLLLTTFLLIAPGIVGCAAHRAGTASITDSAVEGNNNVVSTITQAEANLEFMSETRMRVDEVRGNMTVNNYETAKKATFWALVGRYGMKAIETCIMGLWLKGKKKPIETENGIITRARVPMRGEPDDE